MDFEDCRALSTAEHKDFDKRISELETKVAKLDTQFAVINTKLSAILWGIGTIGVALITVLVKYVFDF